MGAAAVLQRSHRVHSNFDGPILRQELAKTVYGLISKQFETREHRRTPLRVGAPGHEPRQQWRITERCQLGHGAGPDTLTLAGAGIRVSQCAQGIECQLSFGGPSEPSQRFGPCDLLETGAVVFIEELSNQMRGRGPLFAA